MSFIPSQLQPAGQEDSEPKEITGCARRKNCEGHYRVQEKCQHEKPEAKPKTLYLSHAETIEPSSMKINHNLELQVFA